MYNAIVVVTTWLCICLEDITNMKVLSYLQYEMYKA